MALAVIALAMTFEVGVLRVLVVLIRLRRRD